MKSSNLIVLLLSTTLLTGCGGGTSSTQENFVSGNGAVTKIAKSDRKSAPVLSGMTLQGENETIEYGKVTVVNVWASWCSPCRAEIPTLIALSKKFNDAQFVGILTRDNPVNAEAFSRRLSMPYPTFIDDALLIGFHGALAANAIPSTVLIDKKGKVAARISGEITVASLSKLIDELSAE